MTQLTDPAEICEKAVYHLGDSRDLEGTLGLAAFGSPVPFRDVSKCEPGVWAAFCRAKAVVDELGATRYGKRNWSWMAIWRTNEEREALLREAAAWLRDHSGVADIDDELALEEYYPGHYRGIIKDPELSYLGPFTKDNPEDAIADARHLVQAHRMRQAYDSGDDRFEEVNHRVCGTSFSTVRMKPENLS